MAFIRSSSSSNLEEGEGGREGGREGRKERGRKGGRKERGRKGEREGETKKHNVNECNELFVVRFSLRRGSSYQVMD